MDQLEKMKESMALESFALNKLYQEGSLVLVIAPKDHSESLLSEIADKLHFMRSHNVREPQEIHLTPRQYQIISRLHGNTAVNLQRNPQTVFGIPIKRIV